MKRRNSLTRSTRWKRKESEMWKAIEAACPEMGKGIGERKRQERARQLADFCRKYGSLERVYVVKYAMTCIVPRCNRVECDNAHGHGGGMGRKGDHLGINPLCATHHTLGSRSFHNLGSVEAFEAEWLEPEGLTWDGCAFETDQFFREHGPAVIAEAKRSGKWDRWVQTGSPW